MLLKIYTKSFENYGLCIFVELNYFYGPVVGFFFDVFKFGNLLFIARSK